MGVFWWRNKEIGLLSKWSVHIEEKLEEKLDEKLEEKIDMLKKSIN